MKEGQKAIYYITADSHAAAAHSPHLEVFRKHGVEVLLLSDRVDEWLVTHLTEFDGKPLKSVAKGALDLGELESEEDKEAARAAEDEAKDVVIAAQEAALGEKVEDVRVSHRLTDSPACIVLSEHDMALYMQQLLRQAGQQLPGTKPVLEINPGHALIQKLRDVPEEQVGEWAEILFNQALLAEGAQLEDPAGFVRRLNSLILSRL
jgi:molecular chaperone HtpG